MCEPVAETPSHYFPATYATWALYVIFEDYPDVYVGGDMFIYFRQGDPSASVAPDVFAIPGLDKRLRSSYFMWLEGAVPMFIMEVTSNSTWPGGHRTQARPLRELGRRRILDVRPHPGNPPRPPTPGLQAG